MSSISFDNVYMLFIAVPLIALFAVPFALAIGKENRNAHNVASIVLHVVMAIVIAFASAGTNFTTILTETHVYVVADVSYSAQHNLDTIDYYISNLELPRNSKLGLVCFGKDYQLVSELDDPKNIASVKEATVDGSQTNIAEALTYTGTLFTTGVIKRIVLITDGAQTDVGDSGAIRRAVDGLETQNIKVDAIFLDDNVSDDICEVQISNVNFTPSVYLDSDQKARVSVQASRDVTAIITLSLSEQEISRRVVNLSIGLNTVSFDLDTSAQGVFDYEVAIRAEGDVNSYNNSYRFTQRVFDEIRVLVITQSWDDCVAAIERYGDKAVIDVYESSQTTANKTAFANLYADNPNVNIYINNLNVPTSIEDLCQYDEIMLADVDIGLLSNREAFVDSLHTAVTQFGKSLVTVGNLNLQNRGDTELKKFTDMLPVRFGNNDDDPKLYTLVIDGSRSMDNLGHLVIAKQVATHLINILNEEDEVCIITFFEGVRVVQMPEPLVNRNAVIDLINNIETIQGTLIGAGLATAYELMKDLNYSDKQVMLITDGESYSNEPDDPVATAELMYYDGGIVTSVFDVGRQGDRADGSNTDSNAMANKNMLRQIARVGMGMDRNAEEDGNYYYANNVEYFEQIDFGAIVDDLTESIVYAQTSVNVERRTDGVLEGIDAIGIPDVSTFVYGRADVSATTVLTLNYVRKSGVSVTRPLYSYWDVGSGRVATFTSSIGGDWVANWADAGIMDVFLDNVFATGIPTDKVTAPYAVNISREGNTSHIEITLVSLHFDTTASISVTLPNGQTLHQALDSPDGRFLYDLDTTEMGKYTISIDYVWNNNHYLLQTDINVNYGDEYNSFTSFDSSILHTAIDGWGTVSEDGTLTLRNDESELGKYVVDLTIPLLITAVVLFVADIIVRKLKWEDIVSFFKLGKKEGAKK